MVTASSSDKRQNPRHSARLPVRTRSLSLFTTNVSMFGTQIECPKLMLGVITRNMEQSKLQISLSLPTGSEATGACTVVYVSEHEDDCLIGLRFDELEGESREQLRRYLLEYAGPEFVSQTD